MKLKPDDIMREGDLVTEPNGDTWAITGLDGDLVSSLSGLTVTRSRRRPDAMQYKLVIWPDNVEGSLGDLVQEWLNDGWELYGNPTVTSWPITTHYITEYAQALTKES